VRHENLADDLQEERWLRRYRYQHLRTKSEVPMSVQNYDRHGIENLQHDPVKVFDRLKIPPFFIFVIALTSLAYLRVIQLQNEDM
jgi:hypothetical protein